MQLELEDLASGRRYPLGTEAVIGRDRGRTDIALTDDAISKRHARVFCEDDAWYLEDLGSSNGSFLGSLRVDKRAPLAPGDVFRLAELRFRLVEADPNQEGPITAPERRTSTMADSASTSDPQPPPSTTVHRAHPRSDLDAGVVELEARPGLLANAGVALRFYLRAVPRMAINPFGDVRRVIQEQPEQPKEDPELAAFAGVAGLLSGLLYTAAAGTRGALPALFSLVASLLLAAIVALLGLFAHRLLRGLVERLGGDCSPRTRTNALLSGGVMGILTTIPIALALLRPWLEGYAGLLAPGLSLLAALVGVFWLWQWAGYFDLKSWARYLLLGVGLLGVGGAATTLVLSVMAASAPSSAPVMVAKAPRASGAALPAAADRRLPAEAVAPKAAQPPTKPADPSSAPDPAKTATAAEPQGAEATAPAPPKPAAAAPQAASPAAAQVAPPGAPASATVAPVAAAATPFERFAAQRAQIEQTLDADPGLLSRDRALRRRYERLCREEHKLRQRFDKQAKRASAWERAKILPRLHAAQRFERTRALVAQLHAQLPRR